MRYRLLWLSGRLEPELRRLDEIVSPGLSIDIGANHGIYSYALARGGHHVEAFEPQPECAATLRAWANPRVSVHDVALSDTDAARRLNVPVVDGVTFTGYATLERVDGGYHDIPVETRPLDAYQFSNVSFIKIDVEGHEAQVLRGGEQTIRRWRPVILVEVALLHVTKAATDDLFALLHTWGYDGTFLLDGAWHSLSEFTVERHQQARLDGVRDAPYITNFLFRPSLPETTS